MTEISREPWGPGHRLHRALRRTQPLLIDLDNVADDGELGENDNLRSNVENIYGGSGNDSIKSMGAHSTIDGRGGNDH